ncbi:MAG: GNAT family N-acetyltransferase [Flavisolibacter sp.]
MISIRVANEPDASTMLEIYSPHILTSACTFETELPALDQFQQRVTNNLRTYPWLVCVDENRIAGYAYASKHREREAYQWTCECSVYVHEEFKGMAIGKKLYAALFKILQVQGFRNVYAGITQPNVPSERLHAGCGFKLFAVYENIGYKSGKWHNVGWWKLQLNDYDLKPPPPKTFSEVDFATLAEIFLEAARLGNSS